MSVLSHGLSYLHRQTCLIITHSDLKHQVMQRFLPSLLGQIIRIRVPSTLVAVVPSTVLEFMSIDTRRHRGRTQGVSLRIVGVDFTLIAVQVIIAVGDELELISRLPAQERRLGRDDQRGGEGLQGNRAPVIVLITHDCGTVRVMRESDKAQNPACDRRSRLGRKRTWRLSIREGDHDLVKTIVWCSR